MRTRMAVERVGGACLSRIARRLRPATAALHDRRGNAAVEFALVAPPFLLLVMGIIEFCVMFFTSSVIEGATKEAARQIRTGKVQEAANPEATFRNQLCDALAGIVDCTKVVLYVQTFSDFQAVSMPLQVDEDGELIPVPFAPGGSSAVTVVRAVYRWEFMTPLIGNLVPARPGGHWIVSTAAFQNEPYNVNFGGSGS